MLILTSISDYYQQTTLTVLKAHFNKMPRNHFKVHSFLSHELLNVSVTFFSHQLWSSDEFELGQTETSLPHTEAPSLEVTLCLLVFICVQACQTL